MMWWFAVLTVLATAQAATHLGAHFKLQPFGRARQQDERYRYVTAVSQYSSKGNSKLTQADARSIKQEHSSANKAGPGGGSADADGSCPCSDKKLCAYISKDKTPEVMGFFWPPQQDYQHYDWQQLSTVAWVYGPGASDSQLMCTAHARGARAVINADDLTHALADEDARAQWVERIHMLAQQHFLDGINFDYEGPMKATSGLARNYTRLVADTAAALKRDNPHAQVSVDVPWTPFDEDGRNYDWLGLGEAADVLVVMSYDMQAQMYGRCVAAANSPLALVEKGLMQYIDMGIPPSKLLLGVAWYGYDYACQPDSRTGRPAAPDVDLCAMPVVEYAGAPCSDAGGQQHDYKDFMTVLAEGRNSTPVIIDPLSLSPTFNYVHADSVQVHQVWFETPETLRFKYQLVKKHGLRGVAMWNLGSLDHTSSDPRVQRETSAMWQALWQELRSGNPSST